MHTSSLVFSFLGLYIAYCQAYTSFSRRPNRTKAAPLSDLNPAELLVLRAPPPSLTPRVPPRPQPNYANIENGTTFAAFNWSPFALPPVPEGFQTSVPRIRSHDPALPNVAEIGRDGVDGIAVNIRHERFIRVSNVINHGVVFMFIRSQTPYILGVRFRLDNPYPLHRAIQFGRAAGVVRHITMLFPIFPNIALTYGERLALELNRALNPTEYPFCFYYPVQPLTPPLRSLNVSTFTAILGDDGIDWTSRIVSYETIE